MATSQISVRLDDNLLEKLEQVARSRSCTRVAALRAAIDQWMREERGAAQLDSVEARMVATLDAARQEVRRCRNELSVLMAMIDALTRFCLFHAPQVPQESVDEAAHVAEGRYNKHIRQVASLLNNGDALRSALMERTEVTE